MDTALLFARLLLALVFAVAGTAKLVDRAGSQQALAGFGVPPRLAGPFAWLLPLAELLVAAALIPLALAWWSAVAAMALLLLFMAMISLNLARGRTPDCHCFGQLHSTPAGKSTLVRNGVLVALAGFVIWQGWDRPGLSILSWLVGLTLTQIAVFIVGIGVLGLLVAEGWLLLHLFQQNGRLLTRLDALEAQLSMARPVDAHSLPPPSPGLSVGVPAPAFHLLDLNSEVLTLETLRSAGKPIVLIFVDSACDQCVALLPEIARWQHDFANRLTIALIVCGAFQGSHAKSFEEGLTHVLLQNDLEVAKAYGITGTPSGVIVHPDGMIASSLAAGADPIRMLVAHTLGLPTTDCDCGRRNGHHVGIAPATTLAAKSGEPAAA